MPLKILSWNVNGLRSFKLPMIDFLNDLNSDIICMQETKITRDMLTEDLAIIESFTSYFSFSRKRSGYSGVATYVRDSCTPVYACEGLCGTLMPEMSGSTSINTQSCSDISSVISALCCQLPGDWARQTLRDIDNEGRTVITVHSLVPSDGAEGEASLAVKSDPVPLALINVYCPRADPERADRGLYKLQFYRALRLRAALLAEAGARVVVVGDLNTSHQRLDHCDPDDDFHLNPGRIFLDELLLRPQNEMHVSTNRSNSGDSSSQEFSKTGELIISTEESCPDVIPSVEQHNLANVLGNSCGTGNDHTSCRITEGTSGTDHECFDQLGNEENFPLSLEKTDLEGYQDNTDPLMDLKIYREFRMVDTFRSLYPEKKDAFSCWNMKAGARGTNYGTRIDYVLCDEIFFRLVADSLVLQDVMGSDHCPVACVCRAAVIPAHKLPQLCSKNFIEFQGEQQNLFSYFQKIKPADRAHTMVAVISENGKCVSPKRSGEAPDSLKKAKVFDSFFVDNNKARDCCLQGSSQRDASVMYKRTTYLSSPLVGEKRKNSSRSDGVKNKQSKLISFFAPSNAKVSSSQSPAVVDSEVGKFPQPSNHKSIPDGSMPAKVEGNGPISLYEAELKYLRENPDIYKQLNLINDGEINMEVFAKAENGNFGQNSQTDTDSVPVLGFSNRDNVEQSISVDNRSMFSDSNGDSECPGSTAYAANKGSTSRSHDEYASTFISEAFVGRGNLGEPMGASQMERSDEEIGAPNRSPSNCSSRSRVASDWSFLGKKVVAPLCSGHNEPAVLRTSKKKGLNFNRKFYACARGVGRPGQKDAQCNFFKWA